MPSSRRSSQPRDRTRVSCIFYTGRQILYQLCHLEITTHSSLFIKITLIWCLCPVRRYWWVLTHLIFPATVGYRKYSTLILQMKKLRQERLIISQGHTSASLTLLKPLTMWITTNCGKFLKSWEYQTSLLASWETCMQVKKQQLESDMEQMTSSKLGKEYIEVVYSHPAYLTYMHSTSREMLGWMNHNLESSWHQPYGRKWKSWLKTCIQKTKIMASFPIPSWQIN